MSIEFRGWIERCSQHDVTGWTTSPSLEVYVSGESVGAAVIEDPRGDLIAAGLEDARTFKFQFPRPLWVDDRVMMRLGDDTLIAPADKKSHLSRLQTLLAPLDLARPGLEVGPLNRPVIPRNRANVSYVDHDDQHGLRLKYARNLGAFIEDIGEVDFVWHGGKTLKDIIGDRRFSWVVASHVGEHVGDFIGWINELSDVLDDDGEGVVSLALPHRDRTFDARRPVSTFEDLAGAHIMRHTRPSAHQVLRHVLGVSEYWGVDLRKPENGAALQDAVNIARSADFGEYVDVHCSVFTPASFAECYAMLEACGLVKLRLVAVHAPDVDEFFVHLAK